LKRKRLIYFLTCKKIEVGDKMDDISKFQKVSMIARELIDKGQAASMQAALRMAEQQFEMQQKGEMLTPIAPAAQFQKVETPQFEVKPATSEVTSAVVDNSEMLQFRNLLMQHSGAINGVIELVNAHSNTVQSSEQKITAIIADLAEIKEAMKKLAENPVFPPKLTVKDARAGQTQFKEPQQTPTPTDKPASHARTGNYKPEDVSIEKFFYFGGR
jgi:hypothetical protein